MQLQSISIDGVRCITKTEITFDSGINLLYGANGSGKTSVLESLALFAQGRSFCAANTKELINHQQSQLVCTLGFEADNQQHHQAGFSLGKDGKRRIRLDAKDITSMQQLSRKLPMLFVTPRSFQLIEGGARERRKLFDWLVFHVEPLFGEAYSNFARLLAQRNALLKDTAAAIEAWDGAFADACHKLNTMRQRVFQQLLPLLQPETLYWNSHQKIDVSAYKGWSDHDSLENQLKNDRARDQAKGHTTKGAHRFDLVFYTNKYKASQVLSRGEKKRLVLALVFAQIVLAKTLGMHPVLLIDDLTAELDSGGISQTLERALQVCDQLIVSCIDHTECPLQPARVFHVEQGVLTPVAS